MDNNKLPDQVFPETNTQRTLKKIDDRNKRTVIVVIVVLLAATIFGVFLNLKLQQVIDRNQEEARQARAANIDRQGEMKNYIKCILLIRFDSTPEALATRGGAEAALNACAAAKSR